MINADCYASEEDLQKITETDGNCVGIFSSEDTKDFGVIDVENGIIKNIEEKPKENEKGFINAGVYKFTKDIFSKIKELDLSERGEYEITDLITGMKSVELKDWLTITHPWDLLDVNKKLLDKQGSFISKTAIIKENVVIEEPVSIGDDSVIGPNCFVRKYSSIGKNCRIGQSVEVKNSIIMDNTHASHLTYIADSVIGKNVNIGAGFISANLRLDERNIFMRIKDVPMDTGKRKFGVIIGNNTKIGISVNVMPGKKIFSNILVPSAVTIKNDIESQPNVSKMGNVI